jgi:alanyl-tRNA synthetase
MILAMTSEELRNKFLKFFEKNNHAIIPSSSLVPSEEEQLAGKKEVLFTSAGMQPLIPYLLGKPHPKGNRLVNCQKCLRTDDIEEVGDMTHHTFFEMLGSWSLGDYGKDKAIELSFRFLTEELKIPIEKLAVTVFAGDEDAPKDEELAKKWAEWGIPKERIFYLGKEHNWWPTPKKNNDGKLIMPPGPCGPDTEMFYWAGEGSPEGSPDTNFLWVEIWNDVFMEYNKKEDGTLEELVQKNVDTGMGLERTLAVLTGKKSAYETDLFAPIINEIKKSQNNYSERSERIIADHLRAAAFLIAEGITPSSKDPQGSVIFRLIRDAYKTSEGKLEWNIMSRIVSEIINIYGNQYFELKKHESDIYRQFLNVRESIDKGGESEKVVNQLIQKGEEVKNEFFADPRLGAAPVSLASVAFGKVAFDYHQNFGTTTPTLVNIARDLKLDLEKFDEGYKQRFEEHRERSRGELKRFAGGLAGHSEVEVKYHTATHLLHQALRDVLGPTVFQKGSNITPERLRFDFSFDRKLGGEEVREVEERVNQKIREKLIVENKTISLEQAREENAIGLFDEKYTDKVSVYGIGPSYEIKPEETKDTRPRGGYYSFEFCGGPHVKNTGEVGGIKILKEEAISQGIRRIRAVLV